MRMRRCEEPVITLPTCDSTVTAIARDCGSNRKENWASSSAITRAGVSREAEDKVHMSAGG